MPNKTAYTDSFEISGRVLDQKQVPIKGVIVFFENDKVAITGENGTYSFRIHLSNNTGFKIISFGHPDFGNAIRNYHPSMQNSTFNLVLPYRRVSSSGGIIDDFCALFWKPLIFEKHVELTNENRIVLANAGNRMHSSPGVKIKLSGCWHTIEQKKRMEELRNGVLNHFVEKEGISYDRFVLGSHLCRTVEEHIKIDCVRE